MYKEYTIYTKDEDMLLSTEDTYSSDVKKLGAEQSDEHIESDIDVDLADQRNLMADETFICMRTYMDIEINDEDSAESSCPFEKSPFLQTGPEYVKKSKVRGCY
jgi:hypothetical protein